MDSLSNFLQNRQGDFVKLQDSDKVFGPGPVLLLYNTPSGIDDEEIREMVADGAPSIGQDCLLCRLDRNSPELELSLQDALEILVASSGQKKDYNTSPPVEGFSSPSFSPSSPDDDNVVLTSRHPPASVPVLLFSGFRNDEMLSVYNIIGKEIYDETAGKSTPACAKAVPKAMHKPLRQVLDEISGDHQDAMRLDQQG
jgi:hypothetical protein